MSDEEIAQYESDYFDSSDFHTIINYDADVYSKTNDGQLKLLLKFRKKVIDKTLTDMALESYRTQAKVKHNNRGAAAGNLDYNKLPKFVRKYQLTNTHKFRTGYIKNGKKSASSLANLAPSNIAGYFDTQGRISTKNGNNVPCRLTSFTSNHSDLWEKSLPFLVRCDELFSLLTPERHYIQWIKANLTPEFNICETAFSTVTLNYSWRTGLHRDQGDFKKGFGNLIVIEDHKNPNTYQGCYTGFPQYGVAVNCRTGDFLAMDVHEWHCNTEFIPKRNKCEERYSKGVKEWHYNRLSIVCYLRDNMLNCRKENITRQDIEDLEQRYQELYY